MAEPVRIQLSRRKGFNLQTHSLALNGLRAVKVDRTTKWGNPFIAHHAGSRIEQAMSQQVSVACFKSMLLKESAWWPIPAFLGQRAKYLRAIRRRSMTCGANFEARISPVGARSETTPCHADVLLQFANAPAGGKHG